MKTLRHSLLVLLLTVGAGACTTSILGPETDLHQPNGGNHQPNGGNHQPNGGNHQPNGGNLTG